MREDTHKRILELTEEEKGILNGKVEIDKSLYTDDGQFIIDSKKLLHNNELIAIRKHTRFIDFPKHKHNYIEFNYIYEGTLTEIIDNKKIKLKKGELIFLNQSITHEIEASKEEDIIINFIIKPEFFDYLITLLDKDNIISKFLLTTLYKNYREGEYLYFKVSDRKNIQEFMVKIIEELYNPAIMSEATIKLLVGLLIVELIKNSQDIETYSVDNFEKMMIIQSYKYIDEFYKIATLSQLAKDLKQPDYKLSKLIKKHTGMNFKELLQEKRLSKAAELIKSTELTVIEVMEEIGYENPTYFYKIFKTKFGGTPKEFKLSANKDK